MCFASLYNVISLCNIYNNKIIDIRLYLISVLNFPTVFIFLHIFINTAIHKNKIMEYLPEYTNKL